MNTKMITLNFLFFLIFGTGFSCNAQSSGNVGINTASPNMGAILDLNSTNRGLLLPRVQLTNTTVWGLNATPTAGMVVFNENTAIVHSASTDPLSAGSYPINVKGVGVYTWDGFGWVAQRPRPGFMFLGAFFPKTGALTTNGITTVTFGPSDVFVNDIPGATVNNATGAITLPAGTYRLSCNLPVEFPAGADKRLLLMAGGNPTTLGRVFGSITKPVAMLDQYINGTQFVFFTAPTTIYFKVQTEGLVAGDSWRLGGLVPTGTYEIEQLH